MGFTRLLLIGLILFFVWQLYFRFKRMREKSRKQPHIEQKPSIAMLRCAKCGTHIPENEAIHASSGVYCCEQHRRDVEFTP